MFLMTLLVACAGDEPEIVGNAAAGATLYSTNCVSCHGQDGTAGISDASDLTVEVPALDDAEIEDVVLNGKEAMAPFPFDEQEMADLLAHLRATFG